MPTNNLNKIANIYFNLYFIILLIQPRYHFIKARSRSTCVLQEGQLHQEEQTCQQIGLGCHGLGQGEE